MERLSRSGPLVIAGFCLTIALVASQFITAAVHFAARFPVDFTWAEILLNYQTGFVRRGLLGEIYFQLDELAPVRTLAPVVVVIVYMATSAWLIALAYRIRTFAALLFIFAPT